MVKKSKISAPDTATSGTGAEVMLANKILAKGNLSPESRRVAELLAANEELVLSSLRLQDEADIAAQSLHDLSLAVGLDTLTELPNRALLMDRFTHAIFSAKRHCSRLALLLVDLDNFRQVNSQLGHAVGDRMLKHVATSISLAISDVDTVSRHGGDEFLILLTEVNDADDVDKIAREVIAALGVAQDVGGRPVHLTASVGISIYPDHGDEALILIERAVIALSAAKRAGPGGTAYYARREGDPMFAGDASDPELGMFKSALLAHEHHHAQLREANEKLVLAALNAHELLAAAELARLRQADFLAVLAHELRTPLTPIRLAASMLEEADIVDLPKMKAVIDRQVTHITRLLVDVLEVSRVGVGKLRLTKKTLDIAEILDQAIDTCSLAMVLRGQRFATALSPVPLLVHGDAVRLVQVFVNLLDNSSKYTPEGGDIELTVSAVGNELVVSVLDKGIGMSTLALSTMFEPFVQDPLAVAFNGDGLGIGLTVVRELVEAHGGRVVATSEGIGMGSQFVVTLPLAEAQA